MVPANSLSKLLVFSKDGKVYKLPAYIFENMSDSVKLSDIVDDFNDNSKVVGVHVFSSFEEDKSIYFVSEKGLVKRTMLSEFSGDYSSTVAYKLKGEDSLITTLYCDNGLSKDLLLVSSKAMSIRFNCDSISYMGKVASGVTGITLVEDDFVAFAVIIDEENLKKKLILSSVKGLKEEYLLSEVKQQNRAGRGKNILLVVMDDCIKEIRIK
jgi:topoisomerase-4 subunit A